MINISTPIKITRTSKALYPPNHNNSIFHTLYYILCQASHSVPPTLWFSFGPVSPLDSPLALSVHLLPPSLISLLPLFCWL